MSDLDVQIPDVAVIVDKQEPFIVNLLQGDNFSVNVTHGDVYSVVVQNDESLAIHLKDIDEYSVNVTPSEYFNIVLDQPSLVSITTSGLYNASSEYASVSLSSSYAERASYADYAPFPTGSITASSQIIDIIEGSSIQPSSVETNDFRLNAGGVSMVFTGSISTGIFGVSEYVQPFISTQNYSGLTVEYMANRPGASRMGIIIATWSGSAISFTDVSTADVGDTSDINFTFLQFGNQLRLRVNSNGSGSGTWTVQSLFKLFPNVS